MCDTTQTNGRLLTYEAGDKDVLSFFMLTAYANISAQEYCIFIIMAKLDFLFHIKGQTPGNQKIIQPQLPNNKNLSFASKSLQATSKKNCKYQGYQKRLQLSKYRAKISTCRKITELHQLWHTGTHGITKGDGVRLAAFSHWKNSATWGGTPATALEPDDGGLQLLHQA